MRKGCFIILIIFTLSACYPEEDVEYTEEKIPQLKDIEVPTTVFQSEKKNSSIDEEEMKASIIKYLDTNEELFIATYQFEDILYANEKLSEKETEKLNEVIKLVKENDENFAHYIVNNTLPRGYQEDVKRISDYITNSNQVIVEINENVDHLVDNISDGNISVEDFNIVPDNINQVTGRVQKEIEKFLDEKNIETKAFGRE
ncbi:NDxxF motif lipoprotein [Gracilibacillus saliphilus]|uniref:NDxxF motif lipoprotein n=1 Tax=Gracilibacillus saliphilus TaxID=543890 RepID=UPI0013D15386|nr:NDxxF motif lipoprotein [Gracilibacillus saliphilus]